MISEALALTHGLLKLPFPVLSSQEVRDWTYHEDDDRTDKKKLNQIPDIILAIAVSQYVQK